MSGMHARLVEIARIHTADATGSYCLHCQWEWPCRTFLCATDHEPGHDLNCDSHGPDGAMCQKIRNHMGEHMGVDRRGEWRRWL